MTIDEAALADHVRAGVAEPPARPREIVVIEEMPTTLVGKIFKPRLREIAAEEAARELLSDALSGVASEVAASHTERGLVRRQGPRPRRGGRPRRARQIAHRIRGRSLQPRGRRLTKRAADAAGQRRDGRLLIGRQRAPLAQIWPRRPTDPEASSDPKRPQ